jgi:hypothetical protein
MRVLLIAAALLAAACAGPPERDVFLPPYAEKGCWARFYEKADFGLPMRQIEGPTFVEAIPGSMPSVPDAGQAGVQPLFAEARSLMTGPNARIVGYTQPLFRGVPTEIDPGTLVRDAASVGYPGRFASLILNCEA